MEFRSWNRCSVCAVSVRMSTGFESHRLKLVFVTSSTVTVKHTERSCDLRTIAGYHCKWKSRIIGMGEHLVMVFKSGVARVLPQMATSVDRDITMRGQVAGTSQV